MGMIGNKWMKALAAGKSAATQTALERQLARQGGLPSPSAPAPAAFQVTPRRPSAPAMYESRAARAKDLRGMRAAAGKPRVKAALRGVSLKVEGEGELATLKRTPSPHPETLGGRGPLPRAMKKLAVGVEQAGLRRSAAGELRAAPRPVARAAIGAAREATHPATPWEYPKNLTTAVKTGKSALSAAQRSIARSGVGKALGVAGKLTSEASEALGGWATGLGPVNIAKRHAEQFMAPRMPAGKGPRNRYETKA